MSIERTKIKNDEELDDAISMILERRSKRLNQPGLVAPNTSQPALKVSSTDVSFKRSGSGPPEPRTQMNAHVTKSARFEPMVGSQSGRVLRMTPSPPKRGADASEALLDGRPIASEPSDRNDNISTPLFASPSPQRGQHRTTLPAKQTAAQHAGSSLRRSLSNKHKTLIPTDMLPSIIAPAISHLSVEPAKSSTAHASGSLSANPFNQSRGPRTADVNSLRFDPALESTPEPTESQVRSRSRSRNNLFLSRALPKTDASHSQSAPKAPQRTLVDPRSLVTIVENSDANVIRAINSSSVKGSGLSIGILPKEDFDAQRRVQRKSSGKFENLFLLSPHDVAEMGISRRPQQRPSQAPHDKNLHQFEYDGEDARIIDPPPRRASDRVREKRRLAQPPNGVLGDAMDTSDSTDAEPDEEEAPRRHSVHSTHPETRTETSDNPANCSGVVEGYVSMLKVSKPLSTAETERRRSMLSDAVLNKGPSMHDALVGTSEHCEDVALSCMPQSSERLSEQRKENADEEPSFESKPSYGASRDVSMASDGIHEDVVPKDLLNIRSFGLPSLASESRSAAPALPTEKLRLLYTPASFMQSISANDM